MGLLFAFILIIAIPAIAYYELVQTPGVEPPFAGWMPKGGQLPVSRSTSVVASDFGPELDKALDTYIAQQPEPRPSRSEMIRKVLEDRLVHEGLISPGEDVGIRT